jgi:hypothetical protein
VNHANNRVAHKLARFSCGVGGVLVRGLGVF